MWPNERQSLDGRADGQAVATPAYRSYATRPSTTVISTDSDGRSSAGMARGSPESTTRSASLPGVIVPLMLFLEGGEGAVQREHAQRLVDGDALPRTHALPGLRQPGDRRAEIDQHVAIDDRHVGGADGDDAAVEPGAAGIGAGQLLRGEVADVRIAELKNELTAGERR